MNRHPHVSRTIFWTVVLAAGAGLATLDASAQVRVETDAARFDRQTGAAAIPIPDSQQAFPGTTCGSVGRGPTGSGPTVVIPFSTNQLTITGAQGNGLCIFDGGTLIGPPGTMEPAFMTANTIVGNGEDDFLLTFDSEVFAVSLVLLTNRFAHEDLILKDVLGNVIDVVNIDRYTPRNERVFIGFRSQKGIKSILLDTEGGGAQNEGIQAIQIGQTPPTQDSESHPMTILSSTDRADPQ